MESAIKNLENDVLRRPEWKLISHRFDEKWIDVRLEKVKKSFYYFAHEQVPNPKEMQKNWSNLITETYALSVELYRTGIIQFVGKITPKHLIEFSFVNAKEFRGFEEGMLNELGIPKEGWTRFWLFIDVFKNDVLVRMEKDPRYMLWDELLFLDNLIKRGPGKLKPMSPFNWGLSILTGLGCIVSTIDTSPQLMEHSPGISIASITSGIVISSILAGLAAPNKKVDDDPLTILKRRLAKGEITLEEYNVIKETLEM